MKKNWPADHVERRALAELIPYARNSRTHSADQVAQIAASMKEWGWTNPILVDETGMIIAGHARVQAAQLLGFDEAPVMVARGWSEAQKRAYVIADNKLALNAAWDDALLRLEVGDLLSEDVSPLLLGFDQTEIDALLSGGAEGDGAAGGAEGDGAAGGAGAGSLAARFGVPPFTVLNAREGWWQDRKRAWVAIGICSELGRGAPIGGAPVPMDRANATPGGSKMPAADYGKTRARGDGRGRAVRG